MPEGVEIVWQVRPIYFLFHVDGLNSNYKLRQRDGRKRRQEEGGKIQKCEEIEEVKNELKQGKERLLWEGDDSGELYEAFRERGKKCRKTALIGGVDVPIHAYAAAPRSRFPLLADEGGVLCVCGAG